MQEIRNIIELHTAKYKGGLNLYDYSARQYDPAIGQFTSMDPLCEKYYHISPYAYCVGNPVKYVDPDGREPSPYEAALMAFLVYRDNSDKAFMDACKQALKKSGWALSDSKTPISGKENYTNWWQCGLQSELYERTVDGKTEYCYAFAGTNSLEDAVQDISQLFGLSNQYDIAINNAKALSEWCGNKELTFVGHSLGGGEATASSMATCRTALTFNRASVSAMTSLNNNLEYGPRYVVDYIATGPQINGVAVGGDPLSALQDGVHIGSKGKRIPIYISGTYDHSMKRMVEEIKRKFNQ